MRIEDTDKVEFSYSEQRSVGFIREHIRDIEVDWHNSRLINPKPRGIRSLYPKRTPAYLQKLRKAHA